MNAACSPAASETPRSDTPTTTLQHKVEACAASKQLNSKRVKHLLIQRHQFTGNLLNAACQGRSSGLRFDLRGRNKEKNQVPSL